MKMFATIFAIFGLLAISTSANAYWTSEVGNTRPVHAVKQHWGHSVPRYAVAHERRFVGHLGSLSYACRIAASMGGPCGCVAAEKLLGTSAHVVNGINVWQANGWLAFPRTAPAPGTAAVWPGRHVEAVIAVHGDTVTVDGPYGIRQVRTRGLIFVDPHAVRHKHYAGA